VIPRIILAALCFDFVLSVAFGVDFVLGHPVDRLSRFIDLDGEVNLPTWWASVQWFGVAACLWPFAVRNAARARASSGLLFLLPIIFALFSLDEVAKLHEGFGGVLDRFFLDVPRTATSVSKTGVWFLLLGVPFVAAFALLIVALRPHLRRLPVAFGRLVLGMALFFTGAVGIEGLSNLVVQGSAFDTLQVLAEETFEFVGSTIVLWGSYELVREPGGPRIEGQTGRDAPAAG